MLSMTRHSISSSCLAPFPGIVGQGGQANYASENTSLDAFVQYRHSLGWPASSLDIGAIEDVDFFKPKLNHSCSAPRHWEPTAELKPPFKNAGISSCTI